MPPPAPINPSKGHAASSCTMPRAAANHDLWRSIIKEAGLDKYLDEFRLTRGIHKKVDVSDDAIQRLFDLLDREEANHLSKAQLVEGVNRCLYAFGGLALPAHFPAIESLWADASVLLDDEGGQRRGLPRLAFGRIVRRLKMEILLPQHPSRVAAAAAAERQSTTAAIAAPVKTPSSMMLFRKSPTAAATAAHDEAPAFEQVDLKVFDFTKRRMHVHDVSEARLRDFFLGRRVKNTILRWIMVECHDYLNILRLANKFRIHSLLLEDLVKLEAQKAKITNHGGHQFAVFPTMRLSRETERALKAWGESDRDEGGFWRGNTPPFPIRLEEATAGIFAVGAARLAEDEDEQQQEAGDPAAASVPVGNKDTVITIRTTWRATNNRTGQTALVMRKEFEAEAARPLMGQLNPMAALLRMGANASMPSDAAKTPTSGATQHSANTLGTNATGTTSRASLGGTTRRRDLMMASMKQSLRRGLSSQRDSVLGTTAAAAVAASRESRRQSGGSARAPAKPLQRADSMAPGGSSSIPLKDLLSPPRRAPSSTASGSDGGGGPPSAASSPAVDLPVGSSVKVRAIPMEEDEEAARQRAAQADEWEEMFEGSDDEGDDATSLSSQAEEDDWYFDAQMMNEVAEAVYQTNASISGNTAQWLLHGILDHTVDRLLPIVEAYQVRVAFFQDQLHRRGAGFGKKQTSEVMDTKLDLLWIHRRVALLKPLLKHLLRTVPADMQLYYQDIDDHLDRCLEGLSELGNTAQSIVEEAHHHREDRINEILFAITIVTATFTPANFIAGVFGMNFNDGEKPTIPELRWKHGYLWFWLWSFLASSGVVLLVKYQMYARTRQWKS